jgi:hypothetical protein
LLGIRHDGDRLELPLARGDSGEDGVSFGTTRQPKREILDITSPENSSRLSAQGRADGEA